jgi:hypothetical protein
MKRVGGYAKQKYDVYLVGTGAGCYTKNYAKHFLGSTYAVSAEQACNNVRYRQRTKEAPNGGYSYWTLDDSADMGYVEYEYIAVLAD